MTELKIILDDNGNVKLEGPVDNKLLCYGLLEIAKDTISIYHQNAAQRIHSVTEKDLRFIQ